MQFSDCTVLTIAHRLCHAFEADRVMVMAEGRIQVAFHIVVCAKFSFGYKFFIYIFIGIRQPLFSPGRPLEQLLSPSVGG